MCGCRARAAARAAAAAAGGAAPRAVPAPAPRRIPRAPLQRAPPPSATMSVSVLTRQVVVSVPVPVVAAAPAPRGRFQRPRIPFRSRPVVVRPPPPETLVIHDTKIWGPLLWRAIHTAAELTVGRTELDGLWSDFVFELQMSLPCPDCMQHYREWVQAHPLDADVRKWWVDLHNAVNARKGVAPWSLEDVASSNGDVQSGRDAVTALAPMLGPRAHRVLVVLYDRLG